MTTRRRDVFKRVILGRLGLTHGLARAQTGKPGEDWPDDPFLSGNFAPVVEEATIDDLKIIGEIPEGLNGMYARNGPNPQFPPRGRYHWFDGDGMIHGVRLRDGKASYRNRYVRTNGWRAERKAGKALWRGLGARPDLTLLARGLPLFKNAANTALVWHDGRLLALWEGGEPHEVRVPSLDTVGPHTFGGTLRHAFTAHPKVDPLTGEMFFFGYQPVGPYLQYSVADASGKITLTTPIALPRPVMMHDFAVTERHALFLDLPATFSLARMVFGKPVLRFEPERGARIGVLPRHDQGADVRWFEVPSCYVFHTLNAFEDGDAVVLLACRKETFPDALSMDHADSQRSEAPTVLYRWRLDLKTGNAHGEALDDVQTEFPRINDALIGRPTRFGYAMSGAMTGLVKYDLDRGGSQHHHHGPGRTGGEGVFVPRPGATDEDDGWLITYVYDIASNFSELVVLDARDLTLGPLARVLVPRRIPHGFHGTWIGVDQMESG